MLGVVLALVFLADQLGGLKSNSVPLAEQSPLQNPDLVEKAIADSGSNKNGDSFRLEEEDESPMTIEGVVPSLCLREDNGLCSFAMNERYYASLSDEQKARMDTPSVCMQEDDQGKCSFWINQAYLEEIGGESQ